MIRYNTPPPQMQPQLRRYIPYTAPPARAMNMQEPALAISTIGWQEWNEVYEEHMALSRGTIFPCLDLPLTTCGGDRR